MRAIAIGAAILALLVGCGGNGSKSKSSEGERCGPKTCAVGEVCCNESCGICTPPDGACIQLFCGTP